MQVIPKTAGGKSQISNLKSRNSFAEWRECLHPGGITETSRGLSEGPSRYSEGRSDTPGQDLKDFATPKVVEEML